MIGIVLAGGCSTRTKVNKLLLEVECKPLICHTIDSIKNYVDKVVVVTGKYHDELLPILFDVDIVFNKDFNLGMFTSVLTGVKACVGEDVIIIPGDICNVSSATIKALLQGNKDIRIPEYNGIKGHPVYISMKYVKLLLDEPTSSNLRGFINKNRHACEIINVNDPFVNIDIDTMEDYEKFKKILSMGASQ